MSRLDFLNDKVERLTAQIERWEQKPQTDRRIAKIERKQQRLQRALAEIDSINERAALMAELDAKAENADLPVDTFEIQIKQADDITGLTRVEIDVFDSPFDDSFIGGEPLMLMIQGTGKKTRNGTSNFTSRTTLANGPYWDGLSRQTLMMGSSSLSDVGDYPEVSVTLAKDTGEWRDGNPMGDILAIETFAMPADLT